MYQVDPVWRHLIDCLQKTDRNSLVYLLGGVDTGKTTLCRFLVDGLSTTRRVAHIDADPGQAVLGPPTSLGLCLHPHNQLFLRFVGSATPQGHMLQTLTGAKRLAEKGFELGAVLQVCDSPGFVLGSVAHEFQVQMIDLLQPEHLIALQDRNELEPLLKVFSYRNIQIHRVPVSSAIKTRSPDTRRRYRQRRFQAYFKNAKRTMLPLSAYGFHGRVPEFQRLQDYQDRLIALCDRQGFILVLAIVESVDPHADSLFILSPDFDVDLVASIQFGSIFLNSIGQD